MYKILTNYFYGRYKVYRMIIHPEYQQSSAQQLRFAHNDFMLLQLMKKVENFKQVLCLPNNAAEQFVGARVRVSGWGRTEADVWNSGSEYVLQTTSLTVIPNSKCQGMWNFKIGAFHMCALDPKKLSATCHGDSGGKHTLSYVKLVLIVWVGLGKVFRKVIASMPCRQPP
jgi:hypothetical protein